MKREYPNPHIKPVGFNGLWAVYRTIHARRPVAIVRKFVKACTVAKRLKTTGRTKEYPWQS